MSKGKLFVISGASGVGKGTVLAKLMERDQSLTFSVSATTRPPRPGEVDGKNYYFISRESFEDMIAKGEFLEYSAHNANYYGTPRGQMLEKQATGSVLLDIEPNGAKQVKAACPEAVLIFLMPPSMQELERRLRGRGDTPEEQVKLRLERAEWEIEQRLWYDYVLVNDDAQKCADALYDIIEKNAQS